jgi:Domain of unknown function (DUF3482)/Protein of unknown function (DUF2868)
LHAPAASTELIDVTEAQARRLVLAQALEAGDPEGRLVGRLEREQVERDALAATGDPARGEPLDAKAYLLARADRLLGLLSHRQPALAALQHPPAWQTWVAWGLPLLALVAGALIERIDNPKQVNLLSPPLLAFLFWNVAVYVLLFVFAVRSPSADSRLRASWARRARSLGGRAATGLRGQVAGHFQQAWWRAAGVLEGHRWRRILHVSAAAWGVGVALSIVLGGLVREYRIGWESTLLDLPQVHAFLSAVFAPVVALTPLQPFSMDELARLHFGTGEGVGREEARRWVFLYLALLGLVVVVPRLLLAAFAWWRERRLAGALTLDLGDPSFQPVLGRVRPARVGLLLVHAGHGELAAIEQALRQAGGVPPPEDPRETWTVLSTPRGDALQCRVHTAITGAATAPATKPSFWSRLLAPRSDAAERRSPADVVLLAADLPLPEPALAACREPGLPVLWLLGQGAEAEASATLRRAGLTGEVLPVSSLPTWREDQRLQAAIARLLPPYKAPGMERLRDAWQQRAQLRLSESMRVLATELLQAAREAHQLAAEPVGVRQLVVRGEREAQQGAQQVAAAAIVTRLRERQAANDAQLLSLHSLDGVLPATGWQPVLPQRFDVQQAVHEPQAGLAGAASGAAMGAAVDLMTGGLTLGAAAAIGALVGGGAGLVGAVLKNRRTEPGRTSVALGDEMMLALVQSALVRYLAVAHERRGAADTQRWASLAEAAVAEESAALRQLWAEARAEPEGPAEARLTELLQRLALQVLSELHGPV